MACPDCASTATTRRKGRTALGYRRFRCQACRRRFNERTGTPFNDLQYPTDIVLLAVLWRLRYKLGFRDVAELLLQRGFEVTHETIRAWEVRFAPLLADQLRAKRRGQAGGSWYLDGVGTDTAGALLVSAGDNPQRLHSEAAFAHLCGVAPIDASSGLTLRKRLNRGGDRSANHALWRIVMVRMVFAARTRAYVARRTAEGRSKRDIIRSLKRYVARELYRCLPRPEPA